MVTFTRLLEIKMVANSRSGLAISRFIASLLGDSSSSSACCGVIEKYAISLPLTKPEISRATHASAIDTICAAPSCEKSIAPIVRALQSVILSQRSL